MKTNQSKVDEINVSGRQKCLTSKESLLSVSHFFNFFRLVLFFRLFMIFIHQSAATNTGQFMLIVIDFTFPNL